MNESSGHPRYRRHRQKVPRSTTNLIVTYRRQNDRTSYL